MDPNSPAEVAAYNQALHDCMRRIKRAEHPRAYSQIELLLRHVPVADPTPAPEAAEPTEPEEPPTTSIETGTVLEDWHQQGTQ